MSSSVIQSHGFRVSEEPFEPREETLGSELEGDLVLAPSPGAVPPSMQPESKTSPGISESWCEDQKSKEMARIFFQRLNFIKKW